MKIDYRKLRQKAVEALRDENYGDDGDNFHEYATAQVVIHMVDERKARREEIKRLKENDANQAGEIAALKKRVAELEQSTLVEENNRLKSLLEAAEAKQEIESYSRKFDRLWERYDEAAWDNATHMREILEATLNALEAAENRLDVFAHSHAQVIHTRDHYKALWRESFVQSLRTTPKVGEIPGGFSLDDLKELYRDLIQAHTSKAMSGERMKASDRNDDLGWIRQRIVSVKWFVEAYIEAYQGAQPLNLVCSGADGEVNL